MAIETTGVRIVAENADRATKELNSFNSALDRMSKSTTAASKVSIGKSFDFSGVLGKLSGQFQSLNAATLGSIPLLGQASGAAGGLSSAFAALSPTTIAAGAALAGVAVSLGAFLSLGRRGAALQPTLTAFSNIVGGAAAASAALDQMRQDTRGTISDFELMRLTVAGLQGTSSEFRAIVGKDFGAIIDVTNRVAQATGQSAEIVREKFILGLRRQSAKLLDDVGVVVNAEEAYRRYAEAQGVAAGSLNQTQKQAAYAAEALRKLNEVGAEIGRPAAALELLRRPLVAITNILDKLSLAIQPAFLPILQIVDEVSMAMENLATYIFPLVQAGAQVLGAIITVAWGGIKAILDGIFGPLLSLGGTVFPYVAAAALIAADAITAAMRMAVNAVQAVVGVIAGIVEGVFSILGINVAKAAANTDGIITSLATRLAKGGGQVIGAFAAGMIRAGKYVVDAAVAIANIVASFLEGFSPPERGPLSNIDKGGANVARAWAEGFASGIMRPVEEVAAEVNNALGAAGLGGATADAVKARFAQLDAALQPFKDSLEIVKSTVEKIAGFIDPALKVLERQRKGVLEAFAKGKVDAENVRALDRQVQRLNELKELEQDRVDRAELQLKLAQAAQAQERALLEIAARRAAQTQTAADAAIQAGGAGGGGGGAETPATGGAGGGGAGRGGGGAAAGEDSGGAAAPIGGGVADLLDNDAINNARNDIYELAGAIGGGFAEGLADGGFNAALADFQGSTGELGAALSRIQAANPVNKLKEKFAGLAEIATEPLNKLKSVVQTGLDAVKLIFDNFDIATFITTLTATLDTLALTLPFTLDLIKTAFMSPFEIIKGYFVGAGLFSPTGVIVTSMTTLFGEGGALGTVVASIGDLFKSMTDVVNEEGFNFLTALKLWFDDPLRVSQEVIETVMDTMANSIRTFVDSLPAILNSVRSTLQQALLNPFISTLNSIISAVEEIINSAYNSLPAAVRFAVDQLGFSGVDLPQLQGFARGGTASRGLGLVGERGAELVNFSSRAQVFPADVTRAILGMSQSMNFAAQTGGMGSTYNNQRTVNATFNNTSPQQSVMMTRQLEAFGG